MHINISCRLTYVQFRSVCSGITRGGVLSGELKICTQISEVSLSAFINADRLSSEVCVSCTYIYMRILFNSGPCQQLAMPIDYATTAHYDRT